VSEKHIQKQRARVEHWQARFDAVANVPGKSMERSQCKFQLRRANEALIEAQNREAAEMRRHDEPVCDASGNLPWRVFKGSLRIGDVTYRPGQAVDEDALMRSLNCHALISNGWVRRLPEPRTKTAPPAAPPPARPAPPPSNPIRDCALELQRIATARKISIKTAMDIIDSTLLLRAQKDWCERRQLVEAGAWGSPGMMVQSGPGTSRRVFDPHAFLAALQAELDAPQKAEAA
jgi:hypothetical protein